MWNLNNKTNKERNKSRIRLRNAEDKLMVAGGGERVGKIREGEWEIHTSSYGMSKSWE